MAPLRGRPGSRGTGGTVQAVVGKTGPVSDDAKQRLVQSHDEARSVPKYVGHSGAVMDADTPDPQEIPAPVLRLAPNRKLPDGGPGA